MTRKRRKTRSRQERARVHARTRQTFQQLHRRVLEKIWGDVMDPYESPWLDVKPAKLTYLDGASANRSLSRRECHEDGETERGGPE